MKKPKELLFFKDDNGTFKLKNEIGNLLQMIKLKKMITE